jgi:ubiquinone/menaquinone biosynthesis C-methylase UbiE
LKKRADIRKCWNTISKSYQKKHKISTKYAHYGPNCPNENDLNLLGSVKGKRILEIGCGGGQNSIAFAKQGAIATGLDVSEEQLEFAKKLAKRDRVEVEFIQGDMANMHEIKSNSFDIVFTACAICYAPIEKTFKEVQRVLKKNGLFVFSEIHPFYNLFSFDDFTLERSYFKTGYSENEWWYEQNGKNLKTKSAGFSYKVSDFNNALIESGFKIEKVLEPEPVEKDEVSDYTKDYPLERLKMIPGTIIFVARERMKRYEKGS